MYFRLILLFLCLSLALTTYSNSTNEEKWHDSQLQIEQGDYSAAIENLESIENFADRKEVLQNLSFCYLKIGQIGNSVWAAEKGLVLDSNNEELLNLLSAAKATIVNPFPEESSILTFFYTKIPNTLLLVVFLFSLIFLIYNLALKFIKQLAINWAYLIFFGILSLSSLWFGLHDPIRNKAIIVKNQNGYYADFNLDKFIERDIPSGTKVEIVHQKDDKYQLQFSNGIIGVISSEYLRPL